MLKFHRFTTLPIWLKSIALLVSLLFSSQCLAAAKLNGVGAISLSDKWPEMFLAGVYAEEFTISSKTLLDMTGEKRMDIRLTIDEIKTEEFIHIWKQRLATNSGVKVFEANIDNLKEMQKLIGEKLLKSDILAFEKLTDKGAKILLNGVNIGTINDPEFFNFLLRSWVGRQPPSIVFRARLLQAGNIDEDLLARYDAIQPTAERVASIKNRQQPTIAKVNQQNKAVKKAKSIASKSAKNVVKQATKTSVAKTTSNVKKATSNVKKASTVTKAAAKVASIATSTNNSKNTKQKALPKEKTKPANTANNNNQTAKTPKAPTKKKVAKAVAPKIKKKVAPKPKPVKVARSSTPEALVFNKEQAYLSEVQNWVLLHVDYPLLAQQEKREDTVTIAVTIGRSGQLIETSLLNPSQHLELTAAAVAAVNQAEPFPAIPNHLKYDRLTLNIPIEFTLTR